MRLDEWFFLRFIVGNRIYLISRGGKVFEFAMKSGRQDDVNTYIPAQDLIHGSPDFKNAVDYECIATGSVLLVYLSRKDRREFWTLDLMFNSLLFKRLKMTNYFFAVDAFRQNPRG